MLIKHEDLNWRILFDSLLHQLHKEKIQYHVFEDDETLKITTSSTAAPIIKERLLTILSSSNAFIESLPYVVNEKEQVRLKTITSSDLIELPDDNVETGKKILLRLFGNAFEELGMHIDLLFGSTAMTKDRVLFSKVTTHSSVLDSWKASLDYLVAFFKNVSIEQIREAWLTEGCPLPTPPDDMANQCTELGLVSGLIQQCFGIFKNESPASGQIFFNFGRLWEFISVPNIQQQIVEEGTVELSISIKHLLSCLQALTQNRVLFRVYKSEESINQYSAKAIFFGREPTIDMPMHITLIIDRSQSMEEYIEELKKQVMFVIIELAKLNARARVRLVFFANDLIAKEFDITNMREIEEFVKGILSKGSTRLFGTIVDELKELISQKITEKNNSIVLFFTDGRDTLANSESQKFPLVESQIKSFGSLPLPKMFTAGFGDPDHVTLKKLAEIMGNSYIHLQKITDFSEVFEHINANRFQRDMIEFLVNIHDSIRRYRIPYYKSNSLQIPGVIIPLQKDDKPMSVELAGEQLVVTLKEEQIPIATLNDKLADLLIQAREVVANDETEVNTRLLQLKSYLTAIDSIDPDGYHRAVYNYVKSEIESYVDEFKSHLTDTRYLASLGSLTKSKLGFLCDQGPSTSLPSLRDKQEKEKEESPTYN